MFQIWTFKLSRFRNKVKTAYICRYIRIMNENLYQQLPLPTLVETLSIPLGFLTQAHGPLWTYFPLWEFVFFLSYGFSLYSNAHSCIHFAFSLSLICNRYYYNRTLHKISDFYMSENIKTSAVHMKA